MIASPENRDSLSAGELKIEEYVNRARQGEPLESIMQGLSGVVRDAIEKKLFEQEQAGKENKFAIIPPQYKGLDSESLDFIWTIPEYVDTEKTREERERKARALEYIRNQEEDAKKQQEREINDQKEIENLKKELQSTPSEGVDPFQKKTVEHTFGDHEDAVAIYNTIMDMGAGAKEGLAEDYERRMQEYVDEIQKGVKKDYVLGGLPQKWKDDVEARLAKEQAAPKKEQIETKKSFESLSDSEIKSFMDSLPKVPAAPGSRLTVIDPTLLKSRTIRELNEGDKVYTLRDTYITAEVLPKSQAADIGQIKFKLKNGETWATNIIMDTYLLTDIQALYEKK